MLAFLLTGGLLLTAPGASAGADTAMPWKTTQVPAHDPVMIREDSVYYAFFTGPGIAVWSSVNRQDWKREAPVFSTVPDWVKATIPGFRNSFWAPDISCHNGNYYLYYAVSAFGKNTSAIGVAVNKTLHPGSKDYKWVDLGKVVQSVPGRDDWNAIDPNLAWDAAGVPWLTFGSFWGGIKLVRLAEDLRAAAEPPQWYTLAARPRNPVIPDSAAGDGAIEAPFLFRKNDSYFLFVSFDYCCRGEKSTYKMMVGRSKSIQGPYLDRDGVPMRLGGGSVVLEGDKNWYGVGHCAVVTCEDGDYLVFHGYDAQDQGRSKLRVERLLWVNDWPLVRIVH